MKLSHKKVFNIISEKYNLSYHQGEGGFEPKNFYYFMNNEGQYYLIIEIIPRTKSYMKTIYCMVQGSHDYTAILDDIEKLYLSQREGQPCEWVIDFNIKRQGRVF